MIIYFTASMIKYEKFKELEDILTDAIVLNTEFETKISCFCNFYHFSQILDEQRKRRLNLSRVSIFLDLLVQRCNSKHITFKQLQEADLMLFYLTKLNDDLADLVDKSNTMGWFPLTSARDIYGGLPIMAKAIKSSFFDKIKILFRVESKDQLLKKCEEINSQNNWPNASYFRIPYFTQGLSLTTIASLK